MVLQDHQHSLLGNYTQGFDLTYEQSTKPVETPFVYALNIFVL